MCISVYLCILCPWACLCVYVGPVSVHVCVTVFCVCLWAPLYVHFSFTDIPPVLSCVPSKIGKKEKKEERKKIHVRVSRRQDLGPAP